MECLVSSGYNNTSTLEVQKRAGLSRGALLHHFPSKASLMAEVVRYLAELRGRELRDRAASLPEGKERMEIALDLLWECFSSDLFTVAMELRAAARTDPELRQELANAEVALHKNIVSQFQKIFGERFSSQPAFSDALDLTVHLMVGLGMSAMLHDDKERLAALLARWKVWFLQILTEDLTPPR